ncbi:MAG: DUF2007 domain-containing protein [Bryobacterales bacterium]|nr:DUF2007 domain-containing protein [Bryobacterales bacterium]MBV9397126.1 DUF2007 domain-containing protein [Bryobacterales bacterium]
MASQTTVFRSADESAGEDAVNVQQMLADNGIAATLLDDKAPGIPEGAYEVRVDPENVARAEQLVAQFSPDKEMVDIDPSPALDLVTIHRTAGTTNEIETIAIQKLLENAGISAIVVGDARFPSIGQEIRVAREHEARALQLIQEAAATGPAAAEEESKATEKI